MGKTAHVNTEKKKRRFEVPPLVGRRRVNIGKTSAKKRGEKRIYRFFFTPSGFIYGHNSGINKGKGSEDGRPDIALKGRPHVFPIPVLFKIDAIVSSGLERLHLSPCLYSLSSAAAYREEAGFGCGKEEEEEDSQVFVLRRDRHPPERRVESQGEPLPLSSSSPSLIKRILP